MRAYYCHDCRRQVGTDTVTIREPYEFWGEIGYSFDEILTCAQCGSYEIEETEFFDNGVENKRSKYLGGKNER